MAILPVIRESPVQETVQIRNKGSYTIPEEARKAHRLLVDVVVVSVTRNQYGNLNYNLPQGEYGNVTFWSGASINRTEKIKYPTMRLIDWVNVEASVAFQCALNAKAVNTTVGALGLAMGYPSVEGDRRPPTVWGYLTSHLKFVLYPDTQMQVICQWWPWPDAEGIEEPDPDLDDPASGEDEYPEPKRNPKDEPWDGNPPSSGLDQSRDPRDFDDSNAPPPPSLPGQECGVRYLLTLNRVDSESGIKEVTRQEFLGKFVGIRKVSSGFLFGGPKEYFTFYLDIDQSECGGGPQSIDLTGATNVRTVIEGYEITRV